MLILEDQITLSTRYGTSQVQLLLGDITDLPVEDKVDIIFTSAFPGDYSLVKGTLIHALNKNLGVNVGRLAKDKELDLTRIFSCWMSKPLPSDIPYRRLVCFEVKHYQSLVEQISMMFRAIMPIFNGNENTIITPPLATGCQGVEVEKMVGVMVNTACHWIKAGLPLKCMKLVLFSRDPDKARSYHSDSIKVFQTFKEKFARKETKAAITRTLDVTFCYHENDKILISRICKIILKEKNSMAIHQDAFKMNEQASWQDDVFDVMSNSTRIVVALTASFANDKWCLEQFSLAMCCNRLKGMEVVIPFYLETVQAFPSYMNLVQYQDCRTNHKGPAEEKILTACKELIQTVDVHKSAVASQNDTSKDMEKKSAPVKKSVPVYDVFISYCHQTSEFANAAVQVLSKKYPDIKVFFDRSELKTGNLWQQALYEAVDQTRCMFALLSDPYIKSTVCQEEYNISLARLISKDDFMLVPVCLPELSALPKSYTTATPVLVSTADDIEKLLDKITPEVLKLKKLKERKEKSIPSIEEALRHERYLKFSKEFHFNRQMKQVYRLKEDKAKDLSEMVSRISFSYTSDGVKFAAILTEMLLTEMPLATCNLLSYNQAEARREIDNADMIVIFVSNEFLRSQHHTEDLHIALCRQRLIKDRTVIYLVETSPVNEGFYYPSILPFRVSLSDHMWSSFSAGSDFKVKRINVNTDGMQGTYMCSPSELVALQMMTKDIISLLTKSGKGSEIPINLVNVEKIKENNESKEDKFVVPKKVAVSVESYNPLKSSKRDDDEISLSDPESVDPTDFFDEEITEDLKDITEKTDTKDKKVNSEKDTGTEKTDMDVTEQNAKEMDADNKNSSVSKLEVPKLEGVGGDNDNSETVSKMEEKDGKGEESDGKDNDNLRQSSRSARENIEMLKARHKKSSACGVL